MKRFMFAVLVALIALPVFAQDAAAPAPAAAPADAAAPAAALVKVEGKIVVTKAEGQPDVVTVKTADAELTLLPCDKLTELLAVEGLADKTFVLEGEKVPAKDGKSEGFMVKSFEEKKADAPAAPAAPETK